MSNLKVFRELKSTNSIIEKQSILEKYKDDDCVAELLHRALNPYKLYQFNKMPFSWEDIRLSDKFDSHTNFTAFVKLLDSLENRAVTGNEAKDAVFQVFRRFTIEEFEVYRDILLKNAIGITAKTVNKVWPKHIPEFNLMLAPNEIADITKVKYPVCVQPKLDGYRCVYHKQSMYSRSGKGFANTNLANYFSSIFSTNEYTLDGELYAPGYNFNQLQTILNTHNQPLPDGLKYFVYDCVPSTEWDAQKSKKPYSDRYTQLNEVLANIGDHRRLVAISNDIVSTSKEVVDLYKEYLSKNLEGIMIKDPGGYYQWKRVTVRSGEMLKVKPYKTEDLEVTSIYDGEGKFEGMAGGVVVNFNSVSVRVGSGFNDATRKEMAESPSNYIGKTAEIRYFEVTEDGSLRHPTFVRWREEKD